jgi:secreted PhoX family phosphatase
MSESGAGNDPGRIWGFTELGGDTIHGEVLVQGDFARLSRPDNLRYNDAGDLFLMEDHSSGDFTNHPETGNQNDIWILPGGEESAANLVLFATLPHRFEPTGPWFSFDSHVLYLSVQADPPFHSRVIAIRRDGGNWNQPYDR